MPLLLARRIGATLAIGIIVSCTASRPADPATEHARGADIAAASMLENNRLLALAMANGHESLGVLYLLRDDDGVDRVLRRLATLGGSRQRVDRNVGYIRSVVPLQHVQAALDVLPGEVAAIDFDPTIDCESKGSLRDLPDVNEWRRVIAAASSPASRRFLEQSPPLLRDLGAEEWRKAHPAFDGRGVVIGHVEQVVDPSIPQLRSALDREGRPIRKIRSVHLVADIPEAAPTCLPLSDPASQWARLDATVSGETAIEYQGRDYQLPYAGEFQIGAFDLTAIAGKPTWLPPAPEVYVMLWDKARGLVWIDRNGTADFRAIEPLRDFNVSGDWSYFGSMEPSTTWTAVKPAIGFMLVLRPAENVVGVALGWNEHAAGAAASMAGHAAFPGDPAQGVAPGAQLAFFAFQSLRLHSQAEALIAAAADEAVDIVLYEQDRRSPNLAFIGALNQRLAETYGKPILMPAGNSGDVMAVHDLALGSSVIAVGGSQSAESFELYNGFRPAQPELRHGGRTVSGPAPDGGIKPDLLAPAGYVTAVQSWARFDVFSAPDLYTLPPGYQLFGGTSQAGPTAAGAAALLLSAARQEGIEVDGEDLVEALRFGARISPSMTAHEQGNGLIDIANAWRVLRDIARAPADRQHVRVCGGSVRTDAWPDGDHPNPRGVLETLGWSPGSTGVRTVRFCASSDIASLRASLVSGTPAFAIQGTRRIDRTTLAVDVAISPQAAGLHSTILQLSDDAGRPVARAMIAIAAAEPLSAATSFSFRQSLTIPRPGYVPTFVTVPEGIDTMIVSAQREMPFGISIRSPGSSGYEFAPQAVRAQRAKTNRYSVAVPAPQSGTWKILLMDQHDVHTDTRGSLPALSQPVQIEVSGVTRGGVRDTEVVRTRGDFRDQQPTLIPFELAERVDALLIDLGESSADIEGYVFSCVSGPCRRLHELTGLARHKRLTVGATPAGRYMIAVAMAPGRPAHGRASFDVSVRSTSARAR